MMKFVETMMNVAVQMMNFVFKNSYRQVQWKRRVQAAHAVQP